MDLTKSHHPIPYFSSLIVLCTSLAFMSIWIFVPAAKEFSAASMKFNTSMGFVACALSLFFQSQKKTKNLSTGLGLFAFLVGAFTLFEYVSGMNLGIDDVFIEDFKSSESMLHPGRMSPIAAVCFMCAGLHLTLNRTKSNVLNEVSKFLAYTLFYITIFLIIGYLYEEKTLYKIGPYIRISWQSSLSFMVLSIGFLFSELKDGGRTLLASPGLGGMISRRLLPVVILIPAGLGLVWITLRREDFISRELGVSLFVILIIAIFFAMITFLSKHLNAIETKLQKAVVVRDEFISIASHELKTPLTSLKLQNEMFQRRIQKDSNPLEREYLLKIASSVDKHTWRINELISDMLDISRMQSGKFIINREFFDLCKLASDTLEEMMLTALGSERPVLLSTDPVVGSWDRLRIEQVITNLVNNAINYGEKQPIHIWVTRKDENALIIVKDHGIGISEDNFKKIFDRFERVDSRSNNTGLGLGLFITKQIVEAHGGTIKVESRIGEGATFTVSLPLN